ncbi:1-deoxy-D-xylulose-5-phosphate synthase [Rhodopirellula baltica]|uniref:1-deoxy-D-xylulose-5-phosphate synthase n=2 Tax=Rhodopirellula baltica TaxID=265606 RepID=DXS_RHOBA|nr:1-deoxy-D-xylulose-5-phosphate synthase [Rhodopirellula baltica]Q7UWB7.1 RecName: Full=1-deoxy-D-xylulose-5-phosphate synthase; AltName: Full=1-deoxyxylulose-5-phosphate synthase; Short=DXP synthase; Short=DXPS [Rhodopirellula baltica SH 1]EGF28423.1 1-deoxy-D-xylulose-5-phosphate synthase [Rhodopirellula baltica WH47]CAD72449.1 1-deoxy-D-xylulose 5-phosphate synthase [Rhodopirellula baltica SH 1]HBE63554.1 1-deoxy-D-xylulose-5-phosphate synthase [Rhodopirellula baltica]
MTDQKHPLLAGLQDATPLANWSSTELSNAAVEIRDVLCNLLATRTAHFASNLGVVELCLALHSEFDFRTDRLIWDTGHQVYPHKLVTGRYDRFETIRTAGGLMGYPNPHESVYDLFMTGHAGCSVSTAVGLRSGDILMDQKDRRTVAVIGDGAFPCGVVFEALNNAGELGDDLTIILNDNKMSICHRTGSVAQYLDRLRGNPFYTGLKHEVTKLLDRVPMFGDPAERLLAQMKEGVKAGLLGGMLFEELGIRYIGPIDGHDIPLMQKYLRLCKETPGPVLLHVVTEKGHGYKPAAEDPVFFHTPPAFEDRGGTPVTRGSDGRPPYTTHARDAIGEAMKRDSRVTVITAAMCQGNKLEPVREQFPERFFDVGICESHAVAFAAGQCKTGMRPIVDIYSTFLQRSYDQIFQEVALQDLPVVFMMDRAGLTAPDGPTHHGVYDIGYMRLFPNLVLMAPGYAEELSMMLDKALTLDHPSGIRYPKASALEATHTPAPIEIGKAEWIREGTDGTIVAYGAMLEQAIAAAEQLEGELEIGVVNARFVKPIDAEMVHKTLSDGRFVVTLEEGTRVGGFGSAFLESAVDQRLDTRAVHRLALPDEFVLHGDRSQLLDQSTLSAQKIAEVCREAASEVGSQVGI